MIAAKQSVTVTRRIYAAPEKLYAAWTDPAKLAVWWASSAVTVLDAETDHRVGGAWRIVIRGSDGETYEVGGTYRALQPPHKLVFTWMWKGEPDRSSVITVVLRPDGAGTDLTLTHEADADAATMADRVQGWTRTLYRLEREYGTDAA